MSESNQTQMKPIDIPREKPFANDLLDREDFVNEHAAAMGRFQEALHALAANADEPLVLIVDELDRCKPTYAVDMLETVKHVFDVENAQRQFRSVAELRTRASPAFLLAIALPSLSDSAS